MKRVIIFSALVAMMFASCVKEAELTAPKTGSRNTMTLVGESSPMTRISIGDPVDGICPVLWTAGDKIGIFSLAEGAEMNNVPAGLNPFSAGKNSGVFSVDSEFKLAAGNNNLVIYYPYDKDVNYLGEGGGTLENIALIQYQKQTKPNDNSCLSNYGFAYAKATVDGSDPDAKTSSFTLNHVSTYVKIKVSSTEFASYKLRSVVLCDKSSDPVNLAGKVSVNLATGEATTTMTQPWVGVTIQEPETLSKAQEVYLCVLPCDCTGKDIYVVVTMENGTQSVTIPVKVTGKKILANAINVIEVSDVKTADNTFDWFDPVETRYIASNGWCYGNENTIIYKTDKTLDQVASATPLNVSVKAHGNFAGAKRPHHLTIVFAHARSHSSKISHLYINGECLTDFNQRDIQENAGSGTIKTFAVKSDYSFDIKAAVPEDGIPGWGAKVMLYDETNTPIWSFIIWGTNSEIGGVNIGNYVLADRLIAGNLRNDVHIDGVWNSDYASSSIFWQWGRPFAIGWASQIRKVIPSQCTSFQYSAEHCDEFLQYSGAMANAGLDWYVRMSPNHRGHEILDDLWGNPCNPADTVSTSDGHKSIFDPCPKGWRVPSPELIKLLIQNAKYITEDDKADKGHYWMMYKTDSAADPLTYFSFSGLLWGETGGTSSDMRSNMTALPSNSIHYTDKDDEVFVYHYRARRKWAQIKHESVRADRSFGLPVRCMKDTENL